MKNFKKILPAVALASAGIIAAAGAGNASAYSYEQLKGYHNGVAVADGNPENVAVCYTLSNVTIPVATTFTIGLSSNELDMSKVSATSANDTTYTSSSTTTGGFTITFTTSDFSSLSSATKCAHLNFGTALSSTAAFGNYSVDLGVPSSSNDDVPVDFTSGKEISFGYQLSTDTNGYPTTNSSTGVYQAEYWIKSAPTLESSMITSYGHIEVSKKVKGNAANPDESFAFTANVTKLYPSITDTGYNIYVNGSSVKTCAFGTDCVFNLKHGQTAYIGCSSSNCQNDGQKNIGENTSAIVLVNKLSSAVSPLLILKSSVKKVLSNNKFILEFSSFCT